MDTAATTLNNETLDTLGYLIDKFNLTLELSTNQIKDFSVQLSEKIVRWELFTSVFAVIFQLLVIVVVFKLIKHFKIEKLKCLLKQYNDIVNNTDGESRAKHEKTIIHLFTRVIAYFILALTISLMASELKDILLCAVFPEKIILEFIGSYI